MDELEWEIAQVDPRKTIQMGSFRINPDGSQSVVEVSPEAEGGGGAAVSGLQPGSYPGIPSPDPPLHPPPAPQVPYARSEAHLTELLERICEKMKEYGEKADPTTQRKSYVRVISHDGTKLDLSGVKIDGDVASSLKFAVRAGVAAGLGAPRVLLVTPRVVRLQCESIAEEYEDELIEFLSHEADNVKDRLCSKRTGEGGVGRGCLPFLQAQP